MKKGYVITACLYFFVIQFFIIWALWWDSHFYTLWGINFLVFVIFLFWVSVLKDNNKEKKEIYPIVKERVSQERVVEDKVVVEEKNNENEAPRRIRNEAPISESNIEYIKTKINRTKRKPLAEWSPLYRFLVFLLALLGFWGILYLFWESLDFIASVIGAVAMLIFIGVCFKAWNIRRKSLLSSVYFWIFLLLLIWGILWLVFSGSSTVEKVKEDISVFFDGVKWEEINNDVNEEENSWFLYEITGSISDISLTWENIEPLSWDNDIVSSWENEETLWNQVIENDQPVEEVVQQPKEEKTATVENVEPKPTVTTTPKKEPTSQVTMIEAIKHLISAYNIPVSKSTSSKFTYVSKSNANYPYMKTALEKKMIWTTTNPDMIVSCEVYMVMKGLAEGWNIAKSADLKENYWNMAESKGLLNWCVKGAKLTYANL